MTSSILTSDDIDILVEAALKAVDDLQESINEGDYEEADLPYAYERLAMYGEAIGRALLSKSKDLRPLAVVGIHGGLVQWEIVAPGTGQPELYVLDFDPDMDLDYRETTLADYEAAYKAAKAHGVDEGTLKEMREGIANERESIEALLDDEDAS